MDFRYVQDEFWKMERWVKELESRLSDHDQTIGDLKTLLVEELVTWKPNIE